jgi:hypothetical protein
MATVLLTWASLEQIRQYVRLSRKRQLSQRLMISWNSLPLISIIFSAAVDPRPFFVFALQFSVRSY